MYIVLIRTSARFDAFKRSSGGTTRSVNKNLKNMYIFVKSGRTTNVNERNSLFYYDFWVRTRSVSATTVPEPTAPKGACAARLLLSSSSLSLFRIERALRCRRRSKPYSPERPSSRKPTALLWTRTVSSVVASACVGRLTSRHGRRSIVVGQSEKPSRR